MASGVSTMLQWRKTINPYKHYKSCFVVDFTIKGRVCEQRTGQSGGNPLIFSVVSGICNTMCQYPNKIKSQGKQDNTTVPKDGSASLLCQLVTNMSANSIKNLISLPRHKDKQVNKHCSLWSICAVSKWCHEAERQTIP